MDITLFPGLLQGRVPAVPSKSQAQRALICAAFADRPTELLCPQSCDDVAATADCLTALGAKITPTEAGYTVVPAQSIPRQAILPCRQSGATLRFLLPVVGALGVDGTFLLSGRLPERPLGPLWDEMTRRGCALTRERPDALRCTGRLAPGDFQIDGSVSSQFASGLLFAMALMPGTSRLRITGAAASLPYLRMTRQTLAAFGVDTTNFTVAGGRPLPTPGRVEVEGDWSAGAVFLAANALGSRITVTGLRPDSLQADRAVPELLAALPAGQPVSAAQAPDLVPVLAIVAGATGGGVFSGVSRLRLKESDRASAIAAMLRALGTEAVLDADTLTVRPAAYRGCTVNSFGDHRIAMAAAVAATVARGPVTILDAQCVAKSYPSFWGDFRKLGGKYEQHIR